MECACGGENADGLGSISRRSMLAASISAAIGGAVLSSAACSSATPQKSPPALPENALITLGVQVGEVAAAANAKHVILSHYSPTGLPDSEWLYGVGKHYSGKVTVARDGQVFEL